MTSSKEATMALTGKLLTNRRGRSRGATAGPNFST